MTKNKIYLDYIKSNPTLSPFYTALPKEFDAKLKDNLFLSKYLPQKMSPSNHFNIVSGQQPAILGGPLYTYYKIISLSKLSKILFTEFNIQVKPYFWVHSWDHDWEEVCKINFLTYDYQILTITYTPPKEDQGKPLNNLPIDKQYFTYQIEKLFLNIKNSDFTIQLKEEIIQTLNSSSNLSEWSTILLKKFFSHIPHIYFFEPHKQPNFKILIEIISQTITNHKELHQKLSKTTQELAKLNYKPQVHKSEKDAFFFLEENGKRSKILYEDNNFISSQSGNRWTKNELLHILKYEPEKFTPNLITRCIYQQMVLSPIIYIAGPAEIAYWAQLKDLFETFSLPMPIIYPRPHILLIPPKIRKWLLELNIDTSIITQDENSIYPLLSNLSPLPPEVEELRENVKKEFHDTFIVKLHSLLMRYFSNLPEFEKIYTESTNRMANEVDKLISKLNRQALQRNEEINQKITNIRNVLYPNKTHQERFFSPISFFSEYGLKLLQTVEDIIDIKNSGTQEVEL